MDEIFAAKKTSIQMMIDRGYQVSPEEIGLLEMDQHPSLTPYDLDKINFMRSLGKTYHHSMLNEITVVRFASYLEGDGQSVSAKTIKQYAPDIANLRSENPGHKVYYVLIGDTPITSNMSNISKAMGDVDAHDWQYFGFDDLQSSPINHVMQPTYTRLGPEAAAAKIKELKVTSTGMAWMLESDPVARWYWYKVGDVIEALRDYGSIEGFCPLRPNYLVVVQAVR
jgi:DNA-directed RNA polymerase subunit H (RpoH/RPB5)